MGFFGTVNLFFSSSINFCLFSSSVMSATPIVTKHVLTPVRSARKERSSYKNAVRVAMPALKCCSPQKHNFASQLYQRRKSGGTTPRRRR